MKSTTTKTNEKYENESGQIESNMKLVRSGQDEFEGSQVKPKSDQEKFSSGRQYSRQKPT